MRTSRRIPVNETQQSQTDEDPSAIDYHGRLTLDTEVLILVARSGYRPHLTRRLLVGTAAAYGALIGAVLLKWTEAAWRRQQLAGIQVNGTHRG